MSSIAVDQNIRFIEAKDVKAGDWIHPEGEQYPSEVYKVTRSHRVTDIWTGKLKYTRRRFYFDSRTGAKHGAEFNAETMIFVY